MSEAWSKLRDVDVLVDGEASFDFEIRLDEFPRLTPQLARADGSVRGRVRFRRELGLPMADLGLATVLGLICQRCLEPMDLPVDATVQVALLAEESAADRVPEGLETMLVPGNRVSIRDLVEEELLLSLPIVPLHEPQDCAAAEAASPGADEPAEENVQRPFERLGELLKRDK